LFRRVGEVELTNILVSGFDAGGLTIQEMAKALGQDPGALSRGLRKLADKLEGDQDLRKSVQALCEAIRKGRQFKKSISHA
jgi:hypothetical protein